MLPNQLLRTHCPSYGTKTLPVGWNGSNKVTTGFLSNIHCIFLRAFYDLPNEKFFKFCLTMSFKTKSVTFVSHVYHFFLNWTDT